MKYFAGLSGDKVVTVSVCCVCAAVLANLLSAAAHKDSSRFQQSY